MYQGNATVTIAQSGTNSSAVNIPHDAAICGLQMPAGWDAATITLQVSPDGGTTWQTVKKVDGTSYTLTVAAGTYVVIPPADLLGIPGNGKVRLVASAAQTTAERTLLIFYSGSRL